jgi:hypothetical protein|tara:strand:+ start:1898 stop:2806 length:909 start_codon:yes stop_codon:yes gene_type:complete
MNYIKKLRLKERIHVLEDFFYEYIFTKRSIYALGISLVFSFYVIQNSTLQFNISSTLKDAAQASEMRTGLGGVAGQLMIGGGTSDGGSFGEFNSNMHSFALAQRMWQQGWGSKIYGNGDLDEEYFNKIPKRQQTSDRLAAYLMGYELNKYYSAHDLQSYIKSNYDPDKKSRGSQQITISTLHSDKEHAIELMNALIIETDNYGKESLIQKSNEIIASTFKQLATSRNSSMSSALSSTINSEYFKIANLENDMPYHIDIIDPPHSSEYPVSPNITAIIFSNLITFFFLSILFSFFLKNKEDLW